MDKKENGRKIYRNILAKIGINSPPPILLVFSLPSIMIYHTFNFIKTIVVDCTKTSKTTIFWALGIWDCKECNKLKGPRTTRYIRAFSYTAKINYMKDEKFISLHEEREGLSPKRICESCFIAKQLSE